VSSTIDVVVVTQDDPFYIPEFFRSFFDELDDIVSISGVVCLDPFDDSLPSLFRRTYRLYGPRGFLKQGFVYVWRRLLDFAGIGRYSVERVAAAYDIPVKHVERVNDPAFVERIESNDVDVVLSVAAPEIFEEQLLEVPRWGCLNVHTAELPKYRGMMPTFWALYHGETEVGVTVHEMVEELDAGRVATQTTFSVTDLDNLHEVVVRGKRVGGRLAATTLEDLAAGTLTLREMQGEGSYFSFPTAADRRELQSRGWRTV